MHSVLLSDHPKIDPETFRRLLGNDATVHEAELSSEDAVINAARAVRADALVVNATTPVTAKILDSLDLSVVACTAVGVDNVDLDAAASAGSTVLHCPEYCTDEVATHALALVLACVRAIPRYERSVRAGNWSWQVGGDVVRLRGRTIGLLAFGPIARRFAELVSGFDCPVLAYDPYVSTEVFDSYGVESVDFDQLVDRSDILSIHAPLTDETSGMVDRDALSRLGPGAVVVNTGRGGVIEEPALLAALDAGDVAAAGLDGLAATRARRRHPDTTRGLVLEGRSARRERDGRGGRRACAPWRSTAKRGTKGVALVAAETV
jgi:D-3-phosphoglycerate dehydrogenase